MVTAFAHMAMMAKSERRLVVIVLRSQVWILQMQENDLCTSVFPIGKIGTIFRSSVTFGKESYLLVSLVVRRPRWTHNSMHPAVSSGLSIKTVNFDKDDGNGIIKDDGKHFCTSHAVLAQVVLLSP